MVDRTKVVGTVRRTGRGFFLSVPWPDPWRRMADMLAPYEGKRVRVTIEEVPR